MIYVLKITDFVLYPKIVFSLKIYIFVLYNLTVLSSASARL